MKNFKHNAYNPSYLTHKLVNNSRINTQ